LNYVNWFFEIFLTFLVKTYFYNNNFYSHTSSHLQLTNSFQCPLHVLTRHFQWKPNIQPSIALKAFAAYFESLSRFYRMTE
jgi:hypothetical protein